MRGVQFLESETEVSPDGAPWYEAFDVGHPLQQVDLKFNVSSFIGSITCKVTK